MLESRLIWAIGRGEGRGGVNRDRSQAGPSTYSVNVKSIL